MTQGSVCLERLRSKRHRWMGLRARQQHSLALLGLMLCAAYGPRGWGQAPVPTAGTRPAASANDPRTAELDGHAVLTVGTSSLIEGRDFRLVSSSGTWVNGLLARVTPEQLRRLQLASRLPASAPRRAPSSATMFVGRIVLLASLPPGVSAANCIDLLKSAGAAALVLVADESASTKPGNLTYADAGNPAAPDPQGVHGSGVRVPLRLEDSGREPSLTVLTVTRDAMAGLLRAPDGTGVAIAVHILPQVTPRAARARADSIGNSPN